MSRSRSRSLPRERSTRHRRSPSRSCSRSPADRRRRSRSRSRSPSFDDHRKHKKRSKRAKEEKKRHKKHKHRKEKEGEPEGATTSVQAATNEQVNEKTVPVDAKSFFEQLQKQEAAKEPVGTVHARGLPAPVSATAISTSDKWECSKAGCGHMNSKHAPACNKCGAMKRITEWR